jgi:hypothetical protein
LDVVTGAQVAVALTAPIQRELMWDCQDMTNTIGTMVIDDTAMGATR